MIAQPQSSDVSQSEALSGSWGSIHKHPSCNFLSIPGLPSLSRLEIPFYHPHLKLHLHKSLVLERGINQRNRIYSTKLFILFLQSPFFMVNKTSFTLHFAKNLDIYSLPANIFYLGPNKKLNRVNVCQVKFGQMLFQQQPDESFLGISRCHFGCHEIQCCSYSTSFDKTFGKF